MDTRISIEPAGLTPFAAISIVEGLDGEEQDEDVVLEAWQYLVDSGLAWQLQGWYGRTATQLIAAGLISLR
jgi:hypothetical protein